MARENKLLLFFPYIRSNCNQWSSLSNRLCDMKSPLTPRTLEIFYQNNGGNGLLDLLAPEVFYQIMVNLELKDIRICMCVCKKWRVSGRVSTNQSIFQRFKAKCVVYTLKISFLLHLNHPQIIVGPPRDNILFGEYGIKHCLIQMFPEIFSRIIIL